MNTPSKLNLVFASAADNDLYRVSSSGGAKHPRYDAAAEAIRRARERAGVLLLADGYPDRLNDVAPELFAEAAEKRLRLYVEFPSRLPGMEGGRIGKTGLERGVITSEVFGEALPPMSIVLINDCHFVPYAIDEPLIVVARVAGFDRAVYGLPEEGVSPILFQMPGADLLVSTTKLSQFVTARYAPKEAWRRIWQTILGWLCPGGQVPMPDWTPSVRSTYGQCEKLKRDAYLEAIRRGTDWYKRAGMFLPPSCDGTDGIAECFCARIGQDGSQPIGSTLRNDCTSESAMALAMRHWLETDAEKARLAANLQECVYVHSGFQGGTCADPSSATYGLLRWSERSREVFFADDNARSILGTIATSVALNDDRWDERMLRAILGNFRTSGPFTLQGHNLWEPLLHKFGWEHYWTHDHARLAPHFEAWLQACFLWLYARTGFAPLLERTERGIRRMMETYPDQWRWTNGIQQERARMVLPLAWLVRVEDTPEHRAWLHRVADDLLAAQDASGAIREEIGDPGHGLYGPPRSNEAYGTNEAPLIQENGETLADMLYTSNFALLSLTEAAAATGDPRLARAAEKLAEFLVRIQVRSETHPELDGAWFRAFDFSKWEYWGSSADGGWGPWATETGWTQGWIVTTLMLRLRKTSFWDFTSASTAARHMDTVRPVMLPDRVMKGTAASAALASDAGSRSKELRFQYHPDDLWTCYVGRDLETTVDLGETMEIRRLGADFFQAPALGLVLPRQVEFTVSDDGEAFEPAAIVQPKAGDEPGMTVHTVVTDELNLRGRYVRMRAAKSSEAVDDSPHAVQVPNARGGTKVWLFTDEILVNPAPRSGE